MASKHSRGRQLSRGTTTVAVLSFFAIMVTIIIFVKNNISDPAGSIRQDVASMLLRNAPFDQ